MILARNKNGVIGRKTRTMGETVEIAPAVSADPHLSVIVDYNTLESNEAYWKKQEAIHQAQVAEGIRRAKAEEQKRAAEARKLEIAALREQQIKTVHPLQDAIKAYFAQQLTQSETQRVINSIKADFYDREMIPDYQEGVKAGVRSADFNIRNIVGNPLVRDGRYGVVTDFDRIVNGMELDNDAVQIVGGTMVRSLERKPYAQMGSTLQEGEEIRKYGSWDESADSSHASDEDMVTTMAPIRHDMVTTTAVPAETQKTVVEILSMSTTSGKYTICVTMPDGSSDNGVLTGAELDELKKREDIQVVDKRASQTQSKAGKYALMGAAALGIFFLFKE